MNRWLSIITKVVCRILSINISVENFELTQKHRNFLVVGNHLSYLDIFIFSSVYPVSFITSHEMRETFGLGTLCEMSGCVFVERRREKRDPSDRAKELKDIESSLEQGVSVVLYAEATTGDGAGVMPFKKPMFQPAINMKTPILSHVVNYTKIDGAPIDRVSKDFLFWYGEMGIVGHFFKILTLRKVEVEVKFLEILSTEKYSEIEELTNKSHKVVSAGFRPILP